MVAVVNDDMVDNHYDRVSYHWLSAAVAADDDSSSSYYYRVVVRAIDDAMLPHTMNAEWPLQLLCDDVVVVCCYRFVAFAY